MELAKTAAAMTAGLFFSCCLALFAEELVFGVIVRWFFSPAATRAQRTSMSPGQPKFPAICGQPSAPRPTKQGRRIAEGR